MTTRLAAAGVFRWTFASLLSLAIAACSHDSSPSPSASAKPAAPADTESGIAFWPSPQWPLPRDAALEARIDGLLASMRLEEKVGQVIQGDIASMTPEDMRRYHLGSVLNGGGSAPGGEARTTSRFRFRFSPFLAHWGSHTSVPSPHVAGRRGGNVVDGVDQALEKAGPGTKLHAVGEEGVPFREIAQTIGARLGVPVKSVGPDEAFAYLLSRATTGKAVIARPATEVAIRDAQPERN